MTLPTPALPTSSHFHLKQLAEGIYAAISNGGTGSMSNAGIIDLGDITLIFDTFATPQAAQDMHSAAKQLIGHPIASAVNSHKHGDHWWGNQVFLSDAHIIATGRTRAELHQHVDESKEQMQRDLENDIRDLEAKLAEEPNPEKRYSQANEIASRREILRAIPALARTLPTLTFEHQLTLHGSKRTAEVLTYGGGRAASDAFLYLPDDQMLFMGDLLFVRTHPWIGDGNPEEWERILQRVERFTFTAAVPGHGPLGGRSDLALNRDYLASMVGLAEEGVSRRLPPEEATQTKLSAPFGRWEGAEVFDWNMEFLYSRKR